jgi:hypothetical protein
MGAVGTATVVTVAVPSPAAKNMIIAGFFIKAFSPFKDISGHIITAKRAHPIRMVSFLFIAFLRFFSDYHS